MSAWKYKRLMPKIIVDKMNLIESTRLSSLVGMSSSHIYSVLKKTPYNSEISKMNAKGFFTSSLEDALLMIYIKTIEELRDVAPKDIRLMLSCFLLKFEVECVKTLLRVKEAKLSVDEGMKYVFPIGQFTDNRCRQILENSENISNIIDFLFDLEYGLVLEKAFEVYKETKIFHLLSVALDKYVYFKIWDSIGKFRGLDKKIAKRIIG
ncbi:V-type ATPase subunit, partial [Candidatus Bathyarchaeota archaeon]|nr:V-type ATPase subunit [Candidatus Bathyarchaeota archaeon]